MVSTNEIEILGLVASVRGSQAGIVLPLGSPISPEPKRVTVGKFMCIQAGQRTVVGVVTDVRMQSSPSNGTPAAGQTIADVDLIGEITEPDGTQPRFSRGVTAYPAIGDHARLASSDDLQLIFNVSANRAVEIGKLQQDRTTSASIKTDEMLSKHFAVLGTTGVGKSSAVVLLLRQILAARQDLRVLLLDAHNEYARSFGDNAQVLNPRNLKLPFWLFNFEEIVDILFSGRAAFEEEIDLLAEAIPLAKATYAQGGSSERTLLKRVGDISTVRFTADVPVPYRISDLLAILDARMGKLENRNSRMVYHRLITRIDGAINDPRYGFMFENANVGGDSMGEVLSCLFRLPTSGTPMTIMQLAGFPSEVVDAIVSVICRMAFDLGLWSEGNDPLLIVCEEAHRYMAADRTVGFAPTRRALSRIAKEGRKYGVYLGLVTQRQLNLTLPYYPSAALCSRCV